MVGGCGYEMMFLLQPYYDHDRGALDHVLTRVSQDWRRSGRCPETPDLRTDMTAGWSLQRQCATAPAHGRCDRWSARSRAQPSVGSALQRQVHPRKQEEREISRISRPGGSGGERTRRPRSCGERATSGSATSRSRSGGPGCPAAARSPAGGPGHRRSCRPSGRIPGSPCHWQHSSASSAPG